MAEASINKLSEDKENFLTKFRKVRKYKNFTPFTDQSIGFSVTRKLKPNSPNTSLIKVALRENDGIRKPIYIRASYGRLESGVLEDAKNRKSIDPIDVESVEEYYYDIGSGNFYEADRRISVQNLLDKFYSEHIKSTYPIRGLFLRMRMILQIKFRIMTLDILEKFFQIILRLISGTTYSYSPILQEERINSRQQAGVQDLRLDESEPSTIRIFNYEASKWSVLFFIILNLSLYVVLMTLNYKPRIVRDAIENNFLVLLYAILALWIIDSGLPTLLKRGIKYVANKSFATHFKKIKV
jgi:hypothetical protein